MCSCYAYVVDPSSELVDVVDAQDRVIRVAKRSEVRAQNLLHRGVFIAVFSTDRRLLVHQRSAQKDVWPSYWDIAVGGVVGSGESFERAARRELQEEVGIAADPTFLGTGLFENAEVRVLGHCYKVINDGPFQFNDGEVVVADLIGPDQLAAKLKSAQMVPDSIAILLPLLSSPWNGLHRP